MPVRQEIEVKFALTDPSALRASLIRLEATTHGAHYEMNIRLDDHVRSLTGRGIVLRLRRMEAQGEITHLLTVKIPESSADPALAARREMEVELLDGNAMLAALDVLGYFPYWRYEKRRETFSWGQVEVMLDEMPYGWFVELEGPPDRIRKLADRLGFNMADGITLSYAAIFMNVCRALHREQSDLTFEAFAGVEVNPSMYLGD